MSGSETIAIAGGSPLRIWLAPLHGVTNRIYRQAFWKHFHGFDVAMAPFILSARVTGVAEAHFKDVMPAGNAGTPLIPQILGNDVDGFVSTAAALADLGYGEVNWNLGCPYPMVVKKTRGAGLLPFPERIDEFLAAACSRVRIPISVKLRLGLRDKSEIMALMPILNRYPLERVIIHPRVGTQMYTGQVDLGGFEAAAALCSHPVMYNGDIADAAGFEALRSRFPGVSGWMIGRGAVRDPFLPSALRGEAPPANRLAIIMAFHDDLYSAYREALSGPAHVLDKMKEIWSYLGRSFDGCEQALKALGRAKTLDAYRGAVRDVFAKAENRG